MNTPKEIKAIYAKQDKGVELTNEEQSVLDAHLVKVKEDADAKAKLIKGTKAPSTQLVNTGTGFIKPKEVDAIGFVSSFEPDETPEDATTVPHLHIKTPQDITPKRYGISQLQLERLLERTGLDTSQPQALVGRGLEYTYENRIENVTGYIDEDGKNRFHKGTARSYNWGTVVDRDIVDAEFASVKDSEKEAITMMAKVERLEVKYLEATDPTLKAMYAEAIANATA